MKAKLHNTFEQAIQKVFEDEGYGTVPLPTLTRAAAKAMLGRMIEVELVCEITLCALHTFILDQSKAEGGFLRVTKGKNGGARLRNDPDDKEG